MDNINKMLFSVSKDDYGENYHADMLDLYKMYVEMTDRISLRRLHANTWFLTVHTALLTIIGLFLANKATNQWILILVCSGGLTGCYLWRRLILSYQQIKSGCFDIIHRIELKLPLAIYKSEWSVLGNGKDPTKYKPLTDVEKWVPIVIGMIYIGLVTSTLAKSKGWI